MPGYASFAEPWWVPVLYIVIVGHISNLCVTLYLHRSATHEGVKFATPVEHFMRFGLWLTTGMNTREWVAGHRTHRAFAGREGAARWPHTEAPTESLCGCVVRGRRGGRTAATVE